MHLKVGCTIGRVTRLRKSFQPQLKHQGRTFIYRCSVSLRAVTWRISAIRGIFVIRYARGPTRLPQAKRNIDISLSPVLLDGRILVSAPVTRILISSRQGFKKDCQPLSDLWIFSFLRLRSIDSSDIGGDGFASENANGGGSFASLGSGERVEERERDRHHEEDGDVTRSDRRSQGSNRLLGHLRLCDHLLLVA